MFKIGDTYYKEFTTASPSTGAAANSDSLPVATVNRNGSDDSAFVLTVTAIDAGRYKINGTIPTSYLKGDVINVTVAATCSGVAAKACVDTFVLDSKRIGDLQDLAVAGITTSVVAGMATAPVGSVANLTGIALDNGAVSSSPSPTNTTFTATGSLHANAGGYTAAPMAIVWQTGALQGQRYPIQSHTVSGTNHNFTVATQITTPASGDSFVIA